jgi:hypothetical protein
MSTPPFDAPTDPGTTSAAGLDTPLRRFLRTETGSASQTALPHETLVGHARQLGLDTDRFERDLRRHSGRAQVAQDVEGADLSRVPGTPTFFINGRRYYGAYNLATLSQEVRSARARVALDEAA